MAQVPSTRRQTSGDRIDWVAAADIAAGDVVPFGPRIAIAEIPIASGATGALALTGTFRMPKATGAIAKGVIVYWDENGNPVSGDSGSGAITGTASGNLRAGQAAEAALSADETVDVLLGQPGGTAGL